MVDQTRQQRAVPAGVTPPRPRRADLVPHPDRTQLIRVADRDAEHGSRTSPRMRFDVLQLAAWTVGLALIVGALVAIARTGLEGIGVFEPVVTVGALSVTPLAALLWLTVGASVLAAGTGTVAEQQLRITGVVLAVYGLVLLIEPAAFATQLGRGEGAGTLPLAAGLLLVAASFVPPLSIRRPGVREDQVR